MEKRDAAISSGTLGNIVNNVHTYPKEVRSNTVSVHEAKQLSQGKRAVTLSVNLGKQILKVLRHETALGVKHTGVGAMLARAGPSAASIGEHCTKTNLGLVRAGDIYSEHWVGNV